jgi:hypothetical protein
MFLNHGNILVIWRSNMGKIKRKNWTMKDSDEQTDKVINVFYHRKFHLDIGVNS